MTSLKPCAASVLVTWHTIPLGSGELTEYVMSRCCRAVKLRPSVTMYCKVASSLFSMVGL